MIRRSRLKIERIDKFLSIFTAGLFNRPFGYSIVYSSGFRGFPKRPRVFRTLMPRERDLGFMIGFYPKKNAKFLNADLAMINVSSLNARDHDSGKGWIGNLNFKFDSLAHQKLNIGFGASFYRGTVRSNATTYFAAKNSGFDINIASANKNSKVRRDYYGANFQIEYIYGKQPGVGASVTITGSEASQSFSTQPLGNLYLRNFSGYYFWRTHQIAKTPFTALLGYSITFTLNSRLKITLYNEKYGEQSNAT